MSSPKAPHSLKALEARRQKLLRQLTAAEPLIVGNVYDVMRRCGNPSCHCAAKPGHPQTLLIYVEGGRRRCKFIRRDDAQWVKRAWLLYRDCRKALAEIRALNRQELELLRAQIQKRRLSYE